jgi:hypothetical protein
VGLESGEMRLQLQKSLTFASIVNIEMCNPNSELIEFVANCLC